MNTATAVVSLTSVELKRLAELEKTITRNLEGFYKVGMALLEVRDQRLYRETHDTFEAYCQERWDMSTSRAYRLIKAVNVTDNLRPVASVLPVNERQVRPLARLTPTKQQEAWKEVVRTAPNQKITQKHVERVVRRYMGNGPRFSSTIKPSDNWNFSPIEYRREDNSNGYGYIPGDVYANCFWYYVRSGDVVVDPMAAAGMAQLVYDDRTRWMGENSYDFELYLFDLSPQSSSVTRHDLLVGFPTEQADYIFLDPPYYGMVHRQYSDEPRDLANMTLKEWTAAMKTIARHCAGAQNSGALCTVVSPNFRDIRKRRIVLVTDIIRKAWEDAEYRLYDKAYASRRIQQKQNTRMAAVNNTAKANRTMLTDMAEVLTFQRNE